jgi:hypothetical protein
MHMTCQFSWPPHPVATIMLATPRIIVGDWRCDHLSGTSTKNFRNDIDKQGLRVAVLEGTLDDLR